MALGGRKARPFNMTDDLDTSKDFSRPAFQRPTGHMGIYIDLNDAEPIDPKQYGSHIYFMRELSEKFNQELRKVPLKDLKGAFERQDTLLDVVFEGFHDGNIISVSFEKVSGPGDLWRQHEAGVVGATLQGLLVTDALLRSLGARSLQMETRMWPDERDACAAELKAKKVPTFRLQDKANDQEMIRMVKRNQAKVIESMLVLRDALTQFDKNLGEFIMILKQSLPKSVTTITTASEFKGQVTAIKEKNRREKKDYNMKVLDEYFKVTQCILKTIHYLEDHVIHPLLQVHSQCETRNQRELKARLRAFVKDTKERLQPGFDFSGLKHAEWQSKILLREQALLLGLVSVLPLCVDAVVEMDGQVDEYLSGISMKLPA